VATVQTLIDDSSQLAWLFEQQNQILGSFIEKTKSCTMTPPPPAPVQGSSPTPGTSSSEGQAPLDTKFFEGEKILCFHGPLVSYYSFGFHLSL
jgi:hypothetical protein